MMIERRSHDEVVKGKGYVTHIHYVADFNDFELGHTERRNTDWDNRLGYLYKDLSPWITKNILLNAKRDISIYVYLTGGAPGEEVPGSMKSFIEIKFYEKIKWYCLLNGIYNCLSWLAEYHSSPNIRLLIRNLIQLGPSLQSIPIDIQCKTIINIYNEIYKKNHIPGLGEAKVIKKRKLIEIQNNFKIQQIK